MVLLIRFFMIIDSKPPMSPNTIITVIKFVFKNKLLNSKPKHNVVGTQKHPKQMFKLVDKKLITL